MRQVGEQVWVARFSEHSPEWVTCPDCGGTGRIRVIMHDETVVSIDCGNCAKGYEPPKGAVIVYRNAVHTELVKIVGLEIERDIITYKTDGYYIHNSDEVFNTQEEAQEYGERRREQYIDEQKQRIASKEKDTRTWAWNASYHRRQIEKAKKDIAYHESKLAVASLKAKEDRAAKKENAA